MHLSDAPAHNEPPHPSSSGWPRRLATHTALLFGAIVALVGVDLVDDVADGASFDHVLFEGVLALFGAIGLCLVVQQLRRQSTALRREAETRRQEAAALSQEAELLGRAAEARGREAEALGREAEALAERLAATTAEAARWRAEAQALLAGLGAAIATQLDRWGLSPAEQEVALLLLKGLSHKEIGDVRGVSEATTRQQARALYRKAGVAGRSELASFFLEDLLLPSAVSPQLASPATHPAGSDPPPPPR